MSNQTKNIIIAASLVLASFVVGFASKQVQPKETAKARQPVVQTCDTCGSESYVYRFDGKEVTPTTEWCYDCGEIDAKGLDILIAAENAGDDPGKQLQVGRRLFDHAAANFAFRAAIFRDQEDYETKRREFEKEWELAQ